MGYRALRFQAPAEAQRGTVVAKQAGELSPTGELSRIADELTGPRSYGAPVGFTAVDEGRLPGIYVLLFSLAKETRMTIGRLGKLSFPAGWYAYVGSGMNGVGNRVSRHLLPHERPHWHLDYLLPSGTAAAAVIGFTSDRLECQLARRLGQRLRVFRRFGSSDCHCAGHLFHGGKLEPVVDISLDALQGLGCEPLVLAPLPTTARPAYFRGSGA